MNKDILEGKWKQVRGAVKAKWSALTDDDLDRIDGRFEQLVGVIQEKYGESRETVEKAVKHFLGPQDSGCCSGDTHAKSSSSSSSSTSQSSSSSARPRGSDDIASPGGGRSSTSPGIRSES